MSRLDQPVRLDDEEMKIFDDVDKIVERSITVGDPLLAFEFGLQLRKILAIRGVALAKLLYRLQQSWTIYRAAGIEDNLEDMVNVHIGLSPQTTDKYIRMWESIFENQNVPEVIKKLLAGRPVADLLYLTAAIRDGDLEGEDLKVVALAPDYNSLKEIVRQKRGERTSSSSSIILMLGMKDTANMAEGTLYAKRGDERVVIGFLYKTETELAEKAVSQLIRGKPIIEVF